MEPACHVTVEAKPTAADMNAVVQSLLAFNRSHTGGAEPRYLLVTLRDADQALVGGLVGATYLGWLQVHALWVREDLRGRGYGEQLLTAAEEEAVRRGCHHVCLESLSFQAVPFYEKQGYTVYARVPDFPIGGEKTCLSKPLPTPGETPP